MGKQVFKFRIHTGQYDSDGELCVFWIGGRLIPDGPNHAWVTTPKGEKVLRCERKHIESVDNQEITASLKRERILAERHRKKETN